MFYWGFQAFCCFSGVFLRYFLSLGPYYDGPFGFFFIFYFSRLLKKIFARMCGGVKYMGSFGDMQRILVLVFGGSGFAFEFFFEQCLVL